MDELEFRRRVYANPDTTDQDVVAAATADPAKMAFWQEQKQLNRALADTARIDVPPDLAHRLIWQQSANEFVRQRKRNKWYVALAASVAFAIGLSITLLPQQSVSLGNEALVHMQYAETEQAHSVLPVDLAQINAKLAGFGASFTDMIGDVKVANYCHLQSVRSLHLIMRTSQGTVSVFIVPPRDDVDLPAQFADERYHGQAVNMQRANIMVVGDKHADLAPVMEKVRRSMRFSA
ncbi:DUF3379 domain-containing protein [Alteromonas sp. ASW11-19]|uniref:DUF3379 domain-containing protein n=1 Tax=Alteromonas salexigens TaxID=2982530 RepID=A0ABT2VRX2_9ALTE|nr:DUF3379 domain-containing protein [Alteromonas salexigens]MCU7555163.1 DUF3379 domain-containing protein [Alteromonas salexigens]